MTTCGGNAINRKSISTHILTKRMTIRSWEVEGRYPFQLTSSRRGWLLSLHILAHLTIFQLTSSRRGWQRKDWMWSWRNIFQLTSSRRGWRHLIQFRYTGRKFQLTSSRRGWHKHNKKSPNPLHFNSHPHEEDDNFENTGMSSTYIFQLTSSRRGWRQKSFLSDLTVYISTHILTKRMTQDKIA